MEGMGRDKASEGDAMAEADRQEIEIRKRRILRRLNDLTDERGRLGFLQNQLRMQRRAIEAAERRIAVAKQMIAFLEELRRREGEREEEGRNERVD